MSSSLSIKSQMCSSSSICRSQNSLTALRGHGQTSTRGPAHLLVESHQMVMLPGWVDLAYYLSLRYPLISTGDRLAHMGESIRSRLSVCFTGSLCSACVLSWGGRVLFHHALLLPLIPH